MSNPIDVKMFALSSFEDSDICMRKWAHVYYPCGDVGNGDAFSRRNHRSMPTNVTRDSDVNERLICKI